MQLLSPQWKKINQASNVSSTGHCYIATEALFHLLDGCKNKLKPYCATYYEDGMRCSHWWLKDEDGNILDPTADQYIDVDPPYSLGRGCGFQNGYIKPSKRAKKLIDMCEEFRKGN